MTFGRHINGMYEDLQQPRKIGHFLMAIDPGRSRAATPWKRRSMR
jgi:LDH2 family malate/lactate/ureidoglycolate dehydrogenase